MKASNQLSSMQIIPVIDLKAGLVVRGIAGRRDEYQPIVSQIAADASPVTIATAFVKSFSFGAVYVADLDAIAGGDPDWQAYEQIARAGLLMWIDAGIAELRKAEQLLRHPSVHRLVVGLETLTSPTILSALVRQYSAERVIFSLDLHGGQPRTLIEAWRGLTALEIARAVDAQGIRHIIVLDLLDVGTSGGTSTLALAGAIKAAAPQVSLIGGGGVRGEGDLRELIEAGYEGALVASALHDGRLSAEDIASVNRRLP